MKFINLVLNKKYLPVIIPGILFFGLLATVTTAYFITYEENPYDFELAFTEYSDDSQLEGSVVPASCESNPMRDHFTNDCQCNISYGACTGTNCVRNISWNTNLAVYMPAEMEINGVFDRSIPNSGTIGYVIPIAGLTFHVARSDGTNMCGVFVPGPSRPTLSIISNPSSINPGQSSTLEWTVADANTCDAGGGWTGSKTATDGIHAQTVTPAITTVYDLSCDGAGGNTIRQTTVTVLPPVVTLTATPSLLDPGNAAILSWTVAGATTCTASGGWSGAKASANSTHIQSVTPAVTTTYDLSCTGPSGTSNDSVTVTLPTGNITATSCIIPADGISCTSVINWRANNFLGAIRVLQGSTLFDSAAVGTNVNRLVTPDDADFTLRDGGSTFIDTVTSNVTCATRSKWTGTECLRLPDITLDTDSSLIRSGASTTVNVTVNADYPTKCTFVGGLSNVFTHSGTPSLQTYTFSTRNLTSQQIIQIECDSITYTFVGDTDTTLVDVVPISSEI